MTPRMHSAAAAFTAACMLPKRENVLPTRLSRTAAAGPPPSDCQLRAMGCVSNLAALASRRRRREGLLWHAFFGMDRGTSKDVKVGMH
jgi:hypothetical protein